MESDHALVQTLAGAVERSATLPGSRLTVDLRLDCEEDLADKVRGLAAFGSWEHDTGWYARTTFRGDGEETLTREQRRHDHMRPEVRSERRGTVADVAVAAAADGDAAARARVRVGWVRPSVASLTHPTRVERDVVRSFAYGHWTYEAVLRRTAPTRRLLDEAPAEQHIVVTCPDLRRYGDARGATHVARSTLHKIRMFLGADARLRPERT